MLTRLSSQRDMHIDSRSRGADGASSHRKKGRVAESHHWPSPPSLTRQEAPFKVQSRKYLPTSCHLVSGSNGVIEEMPYKYSPAVKYVT